MAEQLNSDQVEVADVTVSLDDGVNADWTKHEWDLLYVTDVDTLRGYLEEVGQRPVDFKESAAYRFGLESQPWLKDAVAQLIRETR